MTKVTYKLSPTLDRVLVRPKKAKDKTDGGLIIPDVAKEKPIEGEIVEVGPGREGHPINLEPGDYVLWGAGAGFTIELNKEELLILRAGDILGVLNKK